MSNVFASPLSSNSTSVGLQKSASNAASSSSSTALRPVTHNGSAPSYLWQPPSHWATMSASTTGAPAKNTTKVKQRTKEEQEIKSRVAANVAARLAADHAAVLNPDTTTPFSSIEDVINRLLPYHVYQQPQEDLGYPSSAKGKRRATELEIEIEDTKFALECHKRFHALEKRFRNARIKEGRRSAPVSQQFVLEQAVLEADRGDAASLTAQLRAARSELDRINKSKQQANNTSTHPSPYYMTAPINPSAPHASYYRAYAANPYAYAAAYTLPMGSIAATSSTSSTATSTSTTVSTSPTASTAASPARSGAAIPVQLPVSSLPALHSLGIYPVPVAPTSSTTANGEQAAVFKGSSPDGSMLHLEINVSLLQSAQMSGLALLLNSLIGKPAPGLAVPQTTAAPIDVPSTPTSAIAGTVGSNSSGT